MDNHPPPTRIRKSRVLHPCPQCGRPFTKRSNMLIHARLHTGEKPYVCRFAGCGRRYKWLSSINFHEGRCDKKSAGLAFPAPKPPPPPAAAEAARLAAAAAAASPQPNPPHIPPILNPSQLQPLPSYQSLQRTTQSRGLNAPPPPPPPPLRPPPQFSSSSLSPSPSHHLLPHSSPHQSHHHLSFPQAGLPTHAQQTQLQPLPFTSHPPVSSPSPPNGQDGPFQQHQQPLLHTPRTGKRFRPEMTPMSPVTPHPPMLQGPALTSYPNPSPSPSQIQTQSRAYISKTLSGLHNINLTSSNPTTIGVNSMISNVSADHIHLQEAASLVDHTRLVNNIVGLSSTKRLRESDGGVQSTDRNATMSATTTTKKRRFSTNLHNAPGSPDSATSQQVKEMLAPYVPENSLGSPIRALRASTSGSTKAESVIDHRYQRQGPTEKMEMKPEARTEPKLESKEEIGASFGFEDEDFLQSCEMGGVFVDLDRDAYSISLEQCSADSDVIPMFR